MATHSPRLFATAFVAVLAILVASAIVASILLPAEWIQGTQNLTGSPAHQRTFGAITLTNLGACGLLYTGVMTAGLSTVAAVGLVGAFIGTSMRAVVSNIGVGETFTSAILYAPFEFGGLALVATAGIYPIMLVVAAVFSGRENLRITALYLDGLTRSLLLLLGGATLIIIGAFIESL